MSSLHPVIGTVAAGSRDAAAIADPKTGGGDRAIPDRSALRFGTLGAGGREPGTVAASAQISGAAGSGGRSAALLAPPLANVPDASTSPAGATSWGTMNSGLPAATATGDADGLPLPGEVDSTQRVAPGSAAGGAAGLPRMTVTGRETHFEPVGTTVAERARTEAVGARMSGAEAMSASAPSRLSEGTAQPNAAAPTPAFASQGAAGSASAGYGIPAGALPVAAGLASTGGRADGSQSSQTAGAARLATPAALPVRSSSTVSGSAVPMGGADGTAARFATGTAAHSRDPGTLGTASIDGQGQSADRPAPRPAGGVQPTLSGVNGSATPPSAAAAAAVRTADVPGAAAAREARQSLSGTDASSTARAREARVVAPTEQNAAIAPTTAGALPTASTVKLAAAIGSVAGQLAERAGDRGDARERGPVRVLSLRLDPAELGSVTVRMRSRGGAIEVDLKAVEPRTARMLEADGQTLQRMLERAGHAVDRLRVDLAPRAAETAMHSSAAAQAPAQAALPASDRSDAAGRFEPQSGGGAGAGAGDRQDGGGAHGGAGHASDGNRGAATRDDRTRTVVEPGTRGLPPGNARSGDGALYL